MRSWQLPVSGGRVPYERSLRADFSGHDVVYFDNGYALQDLVAVKAAKHAGVPIISGHHAVIVHSNDSLSGRMHNAAWFTIGRRQIRRFDAIHALNATDGEMLRRAGGHHVAVIPPPIDRGLFALREKAARPTALFVGRLHHQKGADILLQIVPALKKHMGDLRVQIAGDGPFAGRVAQLAAIDGVEVLGSVERERVAALMGKAHVLIAPSRSETFGFVAAEALSSGTPVVCSMTNGFRDLVMPSTGHLLFDGSDTGEWCRTVSDVMNWYSKEPALQIQERTRGSVARLQFDVVASRTAEFLDQTIATARAAQR